MIRCARHLRCRLVADSSRPLISKVVPEERNDQCRYIARNEALENSCNVRSERECSAGDHAYCCHDKVKDDTEHSCNYNVQKNSELESSRLRVLCCKRESQSFRMQEVYKECRVITRLSGRSMISAYTAVSLALFCMIFSPFGQHIKSRFSCLYFNKIPLLCIISIVLRCT